MRFENPPVTAVDLTVYFEPVQGLQVSHFSALREAWRSEYPDTAELPPLRPQNRDGEETSVVRIDQAWPFPFLMFGSSDNSGTVSFQNDRLTRSWRFTEGSQYPGFVSLAADLESRLREFESVVKAETEQDVRLVGAECSYRNRLDDDLGGGALIGLLTGWQAPPFEPPLTARYSGLRLHMCDDEDLAGCALWISMDVDEDGVFLTLNSETDGAAGDDARLGGLEKAHDQLIVRFLEFTSQDMHRQWGERS